MNLFLNSRLLLKPIPSIFLIGTVFVNFLSASEAHARRSDTTPPTISIVSPASGTTYTSPQTGTISASAFDNRGVSKVEFYRNSVLQGTDTASPYLYLGD